jgi:carboxyl-terminal processing protease
MLSFQNMYRTAFSIVLLVFICAAHAQAGAGSWESAQNPPPVVAAVSREAEASPELRRQAFDIVWKTVKEKHFDPTFGGVDWDSVREKYLPRLGEVKTDRELYDLLQQMLRELHESHFAIYPPDALPDDDSREPASGTVGVDVRIIDGLAVITRVRPGSPAARAGLGPGFVLESIDGTETRLIIQRASSGSDTEGIRRIHQTRAVLARLSGDPGTSVEIKYAGKAGTSEIANIKRDGLTGEMSARMGNFPPQYVEFNWGRVQGGIGYLRFNIFVLSIMDRLRSTIRSATDATGIIIDLRGNPGGVGLMSCGLAGMLESNETSLGTMRMRAGFQNFAVFPQSGAYLGPVVIIIDEMSASTSEVFAGGMQGLGRATVVGTRSAGAALPSFFEKLPTGALFQYAIGDFKTPKGILIEGRGVAPDVEVKLSREALLNGTDPQLDAAIREIDRKRVSQRAPAVHQTQ